MLPAILATFCYAISSVSGGKAARLLGGLQANFYRLLIATFMLGLWSFVWGEGFRGAALPWFVLSGLVGFGICDVALYQALPKIGSRLCALLVNCVAAPVAGLVEWLWLGNALTGAQIASSAVILAGVATALAPDRRNPAPTAMFRSGISLALVAAVANGFGGVLNRKAFDLIKSSGAPMDGMTAAFQRIVPGVIFAGLFLLWMRRRAVAKRLGWIDDAPAETELPPVSRATALRWLLLNATAGATLGVACVQWALKTENAGIVFSIVATTPLVVVPLAWWIEGERPSARSLIGGAVAVGGAVALALVKAR
jgi:drug/metabolite transporter (DMT)-like permease